jgi:hypothetical protein
MLQVKKRRKMRWAGCVASMEGMTNEYKSLNGIPKGKRPLRDLGVDGMMILKRILNK